MEEDIVEVECEIILILPGDCKQNSIHGAYLSNPSEKKCQTNIFFVCVFVI